MDALSIPEPGPVDVLNDRGLGFDRPSTDAPNNFASPSPGPTMLSGGPARRAALGSSMLPTAANLAYDALGRCLKQTPRGRGQHACRALPFGLGGACACACIYSLCSNLERSNLMWERLIIIANETQCTGTTRQGRRCSITSGSKMTDQHGRCVSEPLRRGGDRCLLHNCLISISYCFTKVIF